MVKKQQLTLSFPEPDPLAVLSRDLREHPSFSALGLPAESLRDLSSTNALGILIDYLGRNFADFTCGRGYGGLWFLSCGGPNIFGSTPGEVCAKFLLQLLSSDNASGNTKP